MTAVVAAGVVVAVLVLRSAAVRPVLNRRSGRLPAGGSAPRSRAHPAYVAAEVVKAAALVTTGAPALSAA